MKKTTCSKDKEHRDCIFSTVPSAESLNMLRCSNQDHLSDSIVHFRPIFGRQSCGRWARNEESMTTQTNSVSAKEHVVRTPYSANAFIGATRPVGRHVESQEQYESYLVTKGIPATIVSQFSEDTPMKMTSHGSPSMMTHPATPSWFLLGSQISCSNSHDWGCSPPVGIAMRQDILRGLTPIVESLEASFTATGQLQELLIPKEAKHTCMDGGEKGIPVQVLFHGNYAEVSPILPKIPRFSPSPFQKELLFSQTSNSTYCASTRAEIESADLLL